MTAVLREFIVAESPDAVDRSLVSKNKSIVEETNWHSLDLVDHLTTVQDGLTSFDPQGLGCQAHCILLHFGGLSGIVVALGSVGARVICCDGLLIF